MRYVDDATVRAGLRLLHFRADINPVELSGLLPTRGRLTLPARMTGFGPSPAGPCTGCGR
ncbi:hypothetical protein ACW9HK_34265 [Nocardia gipuzkoensis]